jgi:hypothetical protein
MVQLIIIQNCSMVDGEYYCILTISIINIRFYKYLCFFILKKVVNYTYFLLENLKRNFLWFNESICSVIFTRQKNIQQIIYLLFLPYFGCRCKLTTFQSLHIDDEELIGTIFEIKKNLTFF